MDSRRVRSTGRRRARRRLTILLSISSATFGFVTGFLVFLVHDAPPLVLTKFTHSSAATLVFAHDKRLLGRFAAQGDRRPLMNLQQAGIWIPRAFLAAEDKDFFHHAGIDPIAIIRSSWSNLRHHTIVSGASTITQQTVKLTMFPRQERTLKRKLQEMVLALELEQRQTKSQILLEYVNALYFGSMHDTPVYGVESAAIHAFGKHAAALSPAEAAVLAALPNRPSAYDLWGNPEGVLERERWILSRMHDLGYLSDADYAAALQEDVIHHVNRDPVLRAPYESKDPYILAEVRHDAVPLLAGALHISSLQAQDELEHRGLRIFTSIDEGWQQRVQSVMGDTASFPPPITYEYRDGRQSRRVTNAMEQAGVAIVENGTGRVLAVGGGRNFSINQVDHARIHRQPGSALKPLCVYGPGIEEGMITPATIVDDIPRHYPDPSEPSGDWFPQNWDHKFHGLMTVRDALMQSYNSPAIDVFHRLGTETGARYAWKLGLSGIEREDAQSLGLAIGGTHGGVSPLELAGAYAAVAAGGSFTAPSLIDRIEDLDGQVIYERRAQAQPVFSRDTAFALTTMLRTVVDNPYGTAHTVAVLLPGVPVAGKTGTTDENRDAWFVGFTPQVTLGVWVGYDIPHPLLSTGGYHESSRPARLFAAMMKGHAMSSHAPFGQLPGYHAYTICTKSGLLAGPLCKAAHAAETDILRDQDAPHQLCQLHQLVETTVVDGARVLATDRTPLDDVKEEILFDRPPVPLSKDDRGDEPTDISDAIPSMADPRGGEVLWDK